jgi:putative transposase
MTSASQSSEQTATVKRGRPLSGYSWNQRNRRVSDEQIKEWLLELLAGEEHVYGYRLLAQCLRMKHGLILNDKKAYRLCKELGILHPQRRKKFKHPRRIARNRKVTNSNQLWQMDIKYGYVEGYDRFFFLASIIDVFDRCIVGYHVGSTCEAAHICQVVMNALEARITQPGMKLPVIRTDNGPQFISNKFGDMCQEKVLEHERIPPRTPNMNAYIESFHSLLERDLYARESFQTFEEAYQAVHEYIDFYNNRKMHGSLKRMAPSTFTQWIQKQEDRSDFYRAV